jgi:Xaa-Pro aminopeptidase
VLGDPDARQRELLATYAEIVDRVRVALRPGATVGQLDELAGRVRTRHGLAEYGVYGIGHGIGLRFEEPPASTIIPQHRSLHLEAGMTVTIGHPVLAIPGFGGVRFEDVYCVTPEGGVPLAPYPILPEVGG